MRTDRVGELVEGLGRNALRESGNVTTPYQKSGRPAHILLTFGVFILHPEIDGNKKAYLSSASSKGPVDTGFIYCTLCSLLWNARHSTVEKMVFPTPVFAPYICKVLSRGHKAEPATRLITKVQAWTWARARGRSECSACCVCLRSCAACAYISGHKAADTRTLLVASGRVEPNASVLFWGHAW